MKRDTPPPLLRKLVIGAAWYGVAPLRFALLAVARGGRRGGPEVGAERSVTFLLSSAWGMGGTIRAVLNLAGYLAAHDYDVQVITAYRRRDTPFFGEFPTGVAVIALDDQRAERNGGAAASPAAEALRRIPSVLLHPADRLSRTASLWSDVRLVGLLRARHGHLIGTRPALNLFVSAMASSRFIAVGQEHMHLSAHGPALRRAIRRRYRRLDCVAVLTQADMRDYRTLLRGRGHVVCIPNAVVGGFGARSANLAAPTVIAAGRLEPQKGFDLLVAAFADVVRTHPDWRLKIYGAGTQRHELALEIGRLGLGRSISLEGPTEHLEHEMAQASIFALSSRYEGFPLTLLEAMSTGLAVAAFDCPTGPRDVITDGVNGLLVPAADVDALAAALRRLIEEPELRKRCAEAAREATRRYRLEAIGRQWDRVLRELPGR